MCVYMSTLNVYGKKCVYCVCVYMFVYIGIVGMYMCTSVCVFLCVHVYTCVHIPP